MCKVKFRTSAQSFVNAETIEAVLLEISQILVEFHRTSPKFHKIRYHYFCKVPVLGGHRCIFYASTHCSTSATIMKLREIFASYNLPETMASDNGPNFTSTEIDTFRAGNGIKHTTVNPVSNDQEGRAVRAFKEGKGKMKIVTQLVTQKIDSIQVKKSAGPDNVNPELLKLAGNMIVPSLTCLYQHSLEDETVFSEWKSAWVIPIHKGDDEIDAATDQYHYLAYQARFSNL